MLSKIRALKEKKGFTLVELIVVLVILAILAALLIPALPGYKREYCSRRDSSGRYGYPDSGRRSLR